MSITDELRKWAKEHLSRNSILAIADSIDAEHEAQLKDAFETRNSDENQENDGWVRGPLDADGIMWHEGDMSDSVWGEIELIVRDFDGHWYVKGHDTSAPWVRADSMRHYHEQTVEDVLGNMLEQAVGYSDAHTTVALNAIAECAAKLQLRGDGE